MRQLSEDQKRLLTLMGEAAGAVDKETIIKILRDQCNDYLEDESDNTFDKILTSILLISMKMRKEDNPEEDLGEVAEDLNDSMNAVREFREQLRKKKEE